MNMAEQKIKTSTKTEDITDSPQDNKKLEPDTANINLPDVKDIPGQKHVHVPRIGGLADTTISSEDEEGDTIFNDSIDTEDDTNVTEEERQLLEETSESMASSDDIAL